ncbi:MAG: hypothetical protein J6J12_07530 [Oscillospiraceae bacterium]|nr:hypothetical protein [Oscillospiraceae bacterium]
MKKTNAIVLLLLWGVLTLSVWLLPDRAISDSERRPLAQKPVFSAESLLSGKFMSDFEAYTLDQFPLRDTFRTVKALFHQFALGQKDNNGIYLTGGYAVKQEYPLDEGSIDHAISRFTALYEKYLTDSDIYMAIVPDKNFYFAETAGQIRMDYDRLFSRFREELPWAEMIDLTAILSQDSYYRTDTHWRQEALDDAARAICGAMGISPMEDLQQTVLEQPFYGVYYGQAALPMEPDTLFLLENELLENCTVQDYETGKTGPVYDLDKLSGKDPYEVYLSGPKSLLTIHNPAGQAGKELLIFRDSFGSSIAPLLVADYETVTLIDIRYIQMDVLERFIDFQGQDVLLLYSTLVLNNSETIK